MQRRPHAVGCDPHGQNHLTNHCQQSQNEKNSPPRRSTTVVNQTTVVAPPLVGGFGYGMPFFGGGFGYGMPMFMPVPIFGGLLQLMFLLVIANVVFSIVKGAVNAAGKAGGDKKKDDDWDSL